MAALSGLALRAVASCAPAARAVSPHVARAVVRGPTVASVLAAGMVLAGPRVPHASVQVGRTFASDSAGDKDAASPAAPPPPKLDRAQLLRYLSDYTKGAEALHQEMAVLHRESGLPASTVAQAARHRAGKLHVEVNEKHGADDGAVEVARRSLQHDDEVLEHEARLNVALAAIHRAIDPPVEDDSGHTTSAGGGDADTVGDLPVGDHSWQVDGDSVGVVLDMDLDASHGMTFDASPGDRELTLQQVAEALPSYIAAMQSVLMDVVNEMRLNIQMGRASPTRTQVLLDINRTMMSPATDAAVAAALAPHGMTQTEFAAAVQRYRKEPELADIVSEHGPSFANSVHAAVEQLFELVEDSDSE